MQMEQTDHEEMTRDLEAYRKNGSQELRNKLVLHYLPIVRSAAVQLRTMAGSLLEQEDLTDQGVLALMECLDRYDPGKGARFETYAFVRVRGAMIDYIRSQDWEPHRARNFQKKVDEAFSILSHEKMGEPDVKDGDDRPHRSVRARAFPKVRCPHFRTPRRYKNHVLFQNDC